LVEAITARKTQDPSRINEPIIMRDFRGKRSVIVPENIFKMKRKMP